MPGGGGVARRSSVLEIFHISMLMRFQLGKLNVPAVQPEAGIQLYVYKTNQQGFGGLIFTRPYQMD